MIRYIFQAIMDMVGLFQIAKSAKPVRYEFETLLRELLFQKKRNACEFRDETDGLSILQVVLECEKYELLPAIARAGCWTALLPSVEAIQHYSERAKQKLTAITAWEESLNLIHRTARNGDPSELKKSLRASNPHEVDAMGCTSLYWAVVSGNFDCVKMLVKRNVDPTQVNKRRETLLHIACTIGHTHLLAHLINVLKIDPDLTDKAGDTALLIVVQNGDAKTFARFMACNVKPALEQMLCLACVHGHLNLVKSLIEDHRADPSHIIDSWKSSALMIAVKMTHLELVQYLLTKNVDVCTTDINGKNIFHCARTIAMMTLLVNEIKARKGNNVLRSMLIQREYYIGDELCRYIRAPTTSTDGFGFTWRCLEVERGLLSDFEKQVAANATEQLSIYGPLLGFQLSASPLRPDKGLVQKIKAIINRREASNTSQAFEDATPLHLAILHQDTPLAELILDNIADEGVDIIDIFGLTSLHIAAMRGNVEIAKKLLQRGAAIAALDKRGRTPMIIAKNNGQSNVVDLIKSSQCLILATRFRTQTMPNVKNKLQEIQSEESDFRSCVIDLMRDLTAKINEMLLSLESK